MSLVGKTIVIKGELRATDDLSIEGRVEGPVTCENGAVVIQAAAEVVGDLIARDVTVFGRCSGQIMATEVVDLRAACDVSGHVMAPSFILSEDATFHGRVEPQHLDAALRVAQFKRRQKGA